MGYGRAEFGVSGLWPALDSAKGTTPPYAVRPCCLLVWQEAGAYPEQGQRLVWLRGVLARGLTACAAQTFCNGPEVPRFDHDQIGYMLPRLREQWPWFTGDACPPGPALHSLRNGKTTLQSMHRLALPKCTLSWWSGLFRSRPALRQQLQGPCTPSCWHISLTACPVYAPALPMSSAVTRHGLLLIRLMWSCADTVEDLFYTEVYEKHGSCNHNQLSMPAYFATALELHRRYPFLVGRPCVHP